MAGRVPVLGPFVRHSTKFPRLGGAGPVPDPGAQTPCGLEPPLPSPLRTGGSWLPPRPAAYGTTPGWVTARDPRGQCQDCPPGDPSLAREAPPPPPYRGGSGT